MSEAIRLLQDLVRIPSVNPMGRPLSGPEYFEYQVTEYIEAFFRQLGVEYVRQPVAPLRDNIVAWLSGKAGGACLLLEAHQDTVPAEFMTIEPFGGHIKGGRVHGRGACDIKGGLAAMLAAFARLVRDKPAHAATVVMACVVDEEFTFRGIVELASWFNDCQAATPLPRPDMAVVAEPTNLDIVHAHKGAVRWHLVTKGRSCHSSKPEEGINAIYRMARILVAIEQFAVHLPTTRHDPLLGPPKISVGRIEGGQSVNAVPDRCRIEIDRRVVNGEDPRQAPAELERYLKGVAGIDFPFEMETPWMCKGALNPLGTEKLVARLGRAINAVRGGHQVLGVPYGTDASTLAAAGIPSVVFGPGDIAQAHTCDECVSVEEVEQAAEILYRFAIQE
jgi:acetylornithine deacetylase